jgi:hypothetical protein
MRSLITGILHDFEMHLAIIGNAGPYPFGECSSGRCNV